MAHKQAPITITVPDELLRRNRVYSEIDAEVVRSTEKHGDQNHLPLGTGPRETIRNIAGRFTFGLLAEAAKHETDQNAAAGTVTWANILLEEVFEALAESDPTLVRAELVQVAAVVMKMISAIDASSCPPAYLEARRLMEAQNPDPELLAHFDALARRADLRKATNGNS